MRRWLSMLALCLAMSCPMLALADQTILLTFTGDVTLGGEERTRSQPTSFDSVRAARGDAWFFAEMADFFAEDDVTVVNLEGALADSDNFEVTSKTYRFRGATDMTNILTLASIEACNMGNNHSYDFGRAGYHSTQAALDAADIGRFGEKEVYLFEKGNVKIAFLGLNTTDYYSHREWFRQEIPRLKAEEGVDAVVFTFHVGHEYAEHHIARQEQYAQNAIDAGADLVIMHHPHVVQGMDVYKNRSVFYSLGNFCFGGNKDVRSIEALVVRAELTFSDEGVYLGQRMKLYPANISGTYPENDYQPRLVTGEAAEAVMALLQADTTFEVAPYDDAVGYALQPYLPADADE